MRPRILLVLMVGVLVLALMVLAQGPQQGQPTGTVVPKKPAPTQDDSASTGPKPEVGETVVVKRDTTGPPKKQQKPHPPGELPPGEQPYTIGISVDLITTDVLVTDDHNMFIPGLKKANFRVVEDGVPQNLQTFDASQSPMTVVLLIEFDNLFQRTYSRMWYETIMDSYGFVQTLRKDDWLAIIAYDLKPEILMDFSQNKQEAQAALNRLQYPAFSEANFFDALADTIDRLKDVSGKKGVVCVTTGRDTFSKLTYDKVMKKVKEGQVPVYSISIGWVVREMNDSRMGPINRMDFLQADNALKTFASDSGGRAFFPRFEGEMPGVFNEISSLMRNQYTLGWVPSNTNKDGKFRKVKIDVVDNAGNPLKMVDQKGKELKYRVQAKPGYNAPKGEATVN